ncbi:hypothetical protein GPA22_02370 [Aromatoleum toluvorans]|uniref:Formate dehydrogenase region TAT target n=1 Tax=Aromatoleum toluvorans TaxID=92002 RepID=A0ABX1PTN9_9RHOO|nr:hypothetical protein [Aromatoleum toluvorans]NMG42580.1 hypothetical protein [Aromatoleum toluvorans]
MEDKKSGLQRRHFLLTLGAGGAAAAAAVATVAGKPATVAAPLATVAGEPGTGRGVSEHARNYYRTARI